MNFLNIWKHLIEEHKVTAREKLMFAVDHMHPELVPILAGWFGDLVHVEPITAKKEYFVFNLPKYFEHLLLVNQVQSTFTHANILHLESYWLVQDLQEDITRIVTKTPFCNGGNLENYILSLKEEALNNWYVGKVGFLS